MLYIQTTAHRSTAQHARPEVLPAMTCFSATCRSQCRALLPAALLHTPGCDWCPSASLPLLPAAGCWQQLQHNMCQDPATPLNTVSAACCQFSPCHVSFKPLYTRPPQPPSLWSQGSHVCVGCRRQLTVLATGKHHWAAPPAWGLSFAAGTHTATRLPPNTTRPPLRSCTAAAQHHPYMPEGAGVHLSVPYMSTHDTHPAPHTHAHTLLLHTQCCSHTHTFTYTHTHTPDSQAPAPANRRAWCGCRQHSTGGVPPFLLTTQRGGPCLRMATVAPTARKNNHAGIAASSRLTPRWQPWAAPWW